MQDIAIMGIGQVPVGEHWDKSPRDLAGEAMGLAIRDAGFDGIDAIYVGNMISGIATKQENLGAIIADWTGNTGLSSVRVEAACSSGAAALRTGIFELLSGEIDYAMIVGLEKMSETRGAETTASLATAADADYEVATGLSFVAINALIMKHYMSVHRWHHSDFANFSINSHRNAITNPNARLRAEISIENYLNARMISTPINLLDASPIGDGAAALLLTTRNNFMKFFSNRARVLIKSSSAATDTLAVHDRIKPSWLDAAMRSAAAAYMQADLAPENIDFFELHDAFSIMAALSLEACGFVAPGLGPSLAIEEEIFPGGKLPICTMGGLKARGHPVGATGIYQIAEIVLQLRGQAGENQLLNARTGMAQNIGGSGATVITHILQAD